MPRVRTYGARRVGTAPIPGVRKTAAETPLSTGAGFEAARAETGQQIAGIGEGVARMGASLFGQIQQQERDRADDVALLEASNALARWEQDALYSDTGAFSKQGKDSFGLPETVNADFETFAGAVAKTMTTPRQQAAFARERANRGLNLSATIHRHVRGERNAFEASELQEGVKNGVNAAIANALDPRRVAEELKGLTGRIALHGPRAGMSPEAVKSMVLGAQTDVHVGVINNLLANEKDKAAAIYFEEVKEQIAGDKLDELTKAIEVGGRKREAQRIADEVLLAGGTLTEQREKVRASVEDPEVRADVMGRLEHEAAVRAREDQDRREGDALTATNLVEQTGRFDAIPADLLSRLPSGLRSSLRSYALQKAKGVPIETDLPTYYALMQQAAGAPGHGTPADFAAQNLLNYRHKLDDTEFKELASLQLALRQGDRRKADEDGLAGFRTKNEILENTLTQYGIETRASEQTPAEKAAIAQLQRMLDLRVEAAQASGQKVTNVEIQQTLDELLSQGSDVPGSWWNIWPGVAGGAAVGGGAGAVVGGPLSAVAGVIVGGVAGGAASSRGTVRTRLIDLTITDVPAAERRTIEADLRKRGRPVTDVTVLDLYLKGQIREGHRAR